MADAEKQKWLVTLDAKANVDEFLSQAQDIGFGVSAASAAVPLDDQEMAIEVTGSGEKRGELLHVPGVKAVHPSSDMELY